MQYFKDRGIDVVLGVYQLICSGVLLYLIPFHFQFAVQFIMLNFAGYNLIKGLHRLISNPIKRTIAHDEAVEQRLNGTTQTV